MTEEKINMDYFDSDELFEIERVLDTYAGIILNRLNKLCQTAIHFDAVRKDKENPLDSPIASLKRSYERIRQISSRLEARR